MGGVQQAERRRIFFREDIEFKGTRLYQILEGSKHELIECDCEASFAKVISDLECRPDLVILSLGCAKPSMMKEIRELRSSSRNRQIPILGVTSFAKNGLDIPTLRAHGVVGVIDRTSEPEAVIRRIDSMVGPLACSRLTERVPCFLPVEIMGDSCPKREYALNLSASGIRLTIENPVELNTNLALRFRLPMVSENLINASGRVVHRLPKQNSAGCYEVGVFFYPMPPFSRDVITKEVERLLDD